MSDNDRERLAEIERLLSTYVGAVEIGDRDAEMGRPDRDVVEALSVVRAMRAREVSVEARD